jgi:DNA-binding HxlR family transcriptional regulator
VTKLPFD